LRNPRSLLAILTASLALLLGTPAPSPAGELKVGITQYPSTLHPLIDSMLAKSYVLAMTRRPITAYDHDWQLICMLCVELPSIENGLAVPETLADGTEGIAVTYQLHPHATWGDGTPVTTEDVVLTWEVGRHPKSGVAGFEAFRRILSIDVIDDKTFTVNVDRITFTYNASGGFDLLPAHLERPIFEADPAAYRNRTTFDSDPTNPGLYFGPYRVTQVSSGSHITVEPNPTWYGAEPDFDKITVRVIENTAALEANLLSGAIDMIAGELGLTLDQALAFEPEYGTRYQILFKSGLIYEHLDLNLDNPILGDPRVRQALVLALDRAAISQQLFAGRQPVADASVSPLDWVHSADIPTYPYDPARAAALLEEAGWTLGSDGVRVNAAGERLSLELMTTAGNRSRELVQQVLQSQWRDAGIEARIRNEPARVFFGDCPAPRACRAPRSIPTRSPRPTTAGAARTTPATKARRWTS
jgi:peptide/nickel transport system substrate-binding protein